MSLQRWMLRALRAETRARKAEKRAQLAEQVAVSAMKRLSDDALTDLRSEVGGEAENDDDHSERD